MTKAPHTERQAAQSAIRCDVCEVKGGLKEDVRSVAGMTERATSDGLEFVSQCPHHLDPIEEHI